MRIRTLLSIAGWLATIALAATANAETIVCEEDTIIATITIVGEPDFAAPFCEPGDPLCDVDFECRLDTDGTRVCETAKGWAERTASEPAPVAYLHGDAPTTLGARVR